MMADHAILAGLVTPWLFAAGSAAVSIPIIIHLLAKRRFKRVRWAAIDFLIMAEKENRRRINIQQLILLILRCLAIFLIGLLLARPYMRPTGLAGVFGAEAPRHRVFILDDSFSMSYTTGATTTFDKARSTVIRLLEWSYQEAPHDRITFLKTSRPQVPIVSNLTLNEKQLLELRSTLERLEPSSLPSHYDDLLAQLVEGLLADPQELNTAVYIVSDFQRNDWLSTQSSVLSPQSSSSGSPLSAFDDWPELNKPGIVLIQVAEAERPNVAITALRTTQPQMVATIDSRLMATISNFSSQTFEEQELRVYLNDAAQPTVRMPAISPGQSADVAIDITFPEDDFQQVRVEIPTDSLGLDDQCTTAWRVQSAIKVLLVNGEPSTRTIDDEVAVLRTALHPEGEVFSGVQVAIADESELDSAAGIANLDDVHLLILANVYRLSEETVNRIEAFVAGGGGLAIFLGDQVDAQLYNERLFKNGAGLLPCQLGQVITVTDATSPPGLTGDWTHPMLRVFSGEQNPFLSSLAFWQYFECVPPSTDAGDDEQSNVRVVARFSDARQLPAIVESAGGESGRGKVLLMTSSADSEWNNWPGRPSYLVAMLEMCQYAARPEQTRAHLTAGGSLRVSLDPARYQSEAVLRTPNYPSEPEIALRGEPQADGRAIELHWPTVDQVGVYELLLTRANGAQERRLLSAHLDSRESNLASCTEAELRRSAPQIDFEFVSDVAVLAAKSDEALREFWPALLIGVVMLLMLEQSLACWFGRAS
ncbi:MAG: BatA domain-containing protein [Planctomycetes bacterium]|nr:BatA domain-containing protein [Planctomycetota bacterium]